MANETPSIIPQGGSYPYAYGFVSARIRTLKMFADMPVGTTAEHYQELIDEIRKLDAIISQISKELSDV
jgi:hypothetical protein